MKSHVAELVFEAAGRWAERPALCCDGVETSYAALAEAVRRTARGLRSLGADPGERVAVYLEKRLETVIGLFGAAAADAVFVPVNPLLKPRQVAYILRDCNVRVLVTSALRLEALRDELAECPDLVAVALVDSRAEAGSAAGCRVVPWAGLLAETGPDRPAGVRPAPHSLAAILYTSGSTGLPKGVMLSHRNLCVGAESVSSYLQNDETDRILAALPLSFDAGLSQLTTAFNVGARVTLMNYLFPRDVARLCAENGITGITAVPPLWIQVAQLDWPREATRALRYFANTGGHMPRATLDRLRTIFPQARPFLMYGLTEAFRSTYLDPAQVDARPGSIGKAIPNAEILVVRPDGTPCAADEEGELVHCGPLVALGYWNDPERTARRFRPAPGRPARDGEPEIAVWSGDKVRRDAEGFLYFVARADDMIKTSGYRVSPTEVEEVLYASGLVGEAVALGVPHPMLGQAIVVVATAPAGGRLDGEAVLARCRSELPAFMVPQRVVERARLARNANGKIDRKALGDELAGAFREAVS